MKGFFDRKFRSGLSFGDFPSQPFSPNIFFMGERDLFFGEIGGEESGARFGRLLLYSSRSATSSRGFVGESVILRLIE